MKVIYSSRVHVEDHNIMIKTSQSQKTTQILSIMQAPHDYFITISAQNMIAMTYPINYIHNNEDIVAMWTFTLPSSILF